MREREPESPTAVSFNESVATRIMPDKPAEPGGSEGGKLDEERQVEAALPAGDTTMKLSSAGGTYGEAKRLAEQLGGDDLAFPTLTVRRTILSLPFPGRVSRRFGLLGLTRRAAALRSRHRFRRQRCAATATCCPAACRARSSLCSRGLEWSSRQRPGSCTARRAAAHSSRALSKGAA